MYYGSGASAANCSRCGSSALIIRRSPNKIGDDIECRQCNYKSNYKSYFPTTVGGGGGSAGINGPGTNGSSYTTLKISALDEDLKKEINKLFGLVADGTFTEEEANSGLDTFLEAREEGTPFYGNTGVTSVSQAGPVMSYPHNYGLVGMNGTASSSASQSQYDQQQMQAKMQQQMQAMPVIKQTRNWFPPFA